MKYYNPSTMQEVYDNGELTIDEEINSCVECCGTDIPPLSEEGDFLWVTHRGDYIYVSAMQTDHLFNAFRMVYNHSVPAAFRVGNFIRRSEVFHFSKKYKQLALESMGEELEGRILNQQQRDELYDIESNEEVLRILIKAEENQNQVASFSSDVSTTTTSSY